MKLYRLGANEIRACLSEEDLKGYSVTAEELDYESNNGKKLIHELFDRAKKETGFVAEGNKVYIQLYPKKNGGCEIFVTKLEETEWEYFLFSQADFLLDALELCPEAADGEIYHLRGSQRHLIRFPKKRAPARILEFASKAEPSLSESYLKCKWNRVYPTERTRSYGTGRKKRSLGSLEEGR